VLNQIDDAAANELLTFYQSHLNQGVSGPGKYEAHFSIALLLWRNYGQNKLQSIIDHFRQAAEASVQIIEARPSRCKRTSDDVFNFMFPVLVTYIFGTRSNRKRLALIERKQWAPVHGDEYESLIMLFELLCKEAVKREFATVELRRILKQNAGYSTHPFYRPWIDAMCHALLAIANDDLASLERNIDILIELHADEAYDGSWSRLVEGLIAFWPLAVKVTAEYQGIKPKTESVYMPNIPLKAVD
jgi:hypothetical protein